MHAFSPECARQWHWIDVFPLPPGALVAGDLHRVMAAPAQRHAPLVTGFHGHGPGLGEFQVVWIVRWTGVTNNTKQPTDKAAVGARPGPNRVPANRGSCKRSAWQRAADQHHERTDRHMMNNLLLAPVLGHGRMVEAYLATVALLYGVILLFPDAADTSQATRGAFFNELGSLLGMPFLLKAYFSGYGVIGVIRGWPFSHGHRFTGALIGTALWGWYSAKFALIGAFGTVGFPFATVAVFVCFRVMVLSALHIPPILSPPRWP